MNRFLVMMMLVGWAAVGGAAEGALPVDAGLQLWLDASNTSSLTGASGAVAHGDRISGWHDVLVGGNQVSDDFTQPVARRQPMWFERVNGLNGSSAVLFDGADSFMHCGSLHIDSEMTVFLVVQNAFQRDTAGSIHRPILAADDNPFRPQGTGYGFAYQMPGVDDFVVSLGNDTTEEKLTAAGVNQEDGSFNILMVRRDGAVSSQIWRRTVYDADNQLLSTTDPLTRVSGLHTGYDLGAEPDLAARFYRGFVAEVIVYNEVLSDTEMQQVSDYLHAKHFTLQADDPFGAWLYLPFDGDWRNHGVSLPDTGEVVTYNSITPVFGQGRRGRCLDLTAAQMATSAGCVLYGWAGSSDSPVEQSLNGAASVTICGWFNTADPGVRLKSFSGFLGRLGQLMVRSYDDQSRLVLGVNNQWTGTDSTVAFSEADEWVFWAVTYDGTQSSNNVNWYKGRNGEPLQHLKTQSLNAGSLNVVHDQLAVANLLTNGAYCYAGLLDELRIFGSETDAAGALDSAQLQAVYEHGVQAVCGDGGHPRPQADVDGDCRVDLVDFAELIYHWQIEAQ